MLHGAISPSVQLHMVHLNNNDMIYDIQLFVVLDTICMTIVNDSLTHGDDMQMHVSMSTEVSARDMHFEILSVPSLMS